MLLEKLPKFPPPKKLPKFPPPSPSELIEEAAEGIRKVAGDIHKVAEAMKPKKRG